MLATWLSIAAEAETQYLSPLHNLQRSLVLLYWPFWTCSGWHRDSWRAQSLRLKWACRFHGARAKSADDHRELQRRSKRQ